MDTSNYLTEKDLQEIEERVNAASPGPWISYIEGRDHESDLPPRNCAIEKESILVKPAIEPETRFCREKE